MIHGNRLAIQPEDGDKGKRDNRHGHEYLQERKPPDRLPVMPPFVNRNYWVSPHARSILGALQIDIVLNDFHVWQKWGYMV